MRTATAALLMVLAFGAMAGAVLWVRQAANAQADGEIVPVMLPASGHVPRPGWLHHHTDS